MYLQVFTVFVVSFLALLIDIDPSRAEGNLDYGTHQTTDTIGAAVTAFARQHRTKFAVPPTTTNLAPKSHDAETAVPRSDDLAVLNAIIAQEQKRLHNKAYPLLAAKWPDPVIIVCWENPSAEDQEARHIVEAAVGETWGFHARLAFVFWKRCLSDMKGVRIRITSNLAIGSGVKFLGKFLAYNHQGQETLVRDGMTLNFASPAKQPACATRIRDCIAVLAVHEFGHAIGFAHEQNRHDTPFECTEPVQGPAGDTLDLTPWDRDSIMNYCREIYSGARTLSALDIVAVQEIYGKR
jgi:hypothetical protein